MNMHPNTLTGNSLFVTRSTIGNAGADDAAAVADDERLRLWTGESAYCTCAHHLDVHSRNDGEPGHGQCCSIRGCHCIYFSPHKVKRPKFRQREGSW